MTRDEILAMKPGPAMDVAVAEHVMGTKVLSAFSTDIAAAMRVLCKARKGGPFSISGIDSRYTCILWMSSATAATIAEAICKAALLAVAK